MNLHEILMHKARSGKLGHFYILETSLAEELAFSSLTEFTHQFIRDYYQQVEGHKQSMINLMDHPDVFVLGNLPLQEEKETKAFSVEESEQVNRFFEFRPVQGKRKFAVITEAHRVNQTVSNKWLKLLEEPQGESTIFLLNPRGQKLLATIHSRAIHLKLISAPIPHDPTPWNEFIDQIRRMTLASFLEQFSKGELPLAFWINQLILWESEQLDQISGKQHMERFLKHLQEMETFNQPAATKWTLFYCYLEQQVLPRVSR